MTFLFFAPIILLEAAILPLPLTAAFITTLSILRKDAIPLTIGLFYGISLDFLSAGIIGTSSMIFLVISLIIMLYKRKFRWQSMWFVLCSLLVSLSIFLFIKNDFAFDLSQTVRAILTSLAVGCIWLVYLRRLRYEAWT